MTFTPTVRKLILEEEDHKLGDAIRIGPDGAPGPSAPALDVVGGSAAPGDSPACTLLTASSGTAEASWFPPSSGVVITNVVEAEQTELFIGLFGQADAHAPDAVSVAALQHGDTIWLPALPDSLGWTLRLEVAGAWTMRVCSRV